MGAHEIVASGSVTSGALTIRDRGVFAQALKAMRDGEVLVRIERAKATRSGQQNRWYWGCVVKLVADHTGYTPDEIHEIYKAKFIPKELAILDGNGDVTDKFVLGGSTTQLSVEDFASYCERIREWAADELDVYIPDPQ
jgi:hypothetical protein